MCYLLAIRALESSLTVLIVAQRERAWIGKKLCIGRIKHINIMPEGEDNSDDDEFYGDQESDASPDSVLSSHQSSSLISNNNQFGNIANHEYKSREESIKTLSYLDGYDEMKEVKIQDGFSFGYKSSFHDAYKIGGCLGRVCAQAALDDLLVKTNNKDTTAAIDKEDKIDREALPPPHKSTATVIRTFLRDEILIGYTKEEDAQQKYDMALSKLKDDLK